jgi:hypothetical protein
MMFKNKRKLQLLATFTTLFLLSFSMSCTGFFVNSPISTITINFTNGSSVEVGKTTNLQAYAVNQDGTAGNLKSNVSWSNCIDTSDTTLTDGTVVGTGGAVLTGTAIGSCSITASSQNITGSATATIFITGVTTITVSPSSNTATHGGIAVYFTATDGPTGPDLTSTATWHIVDPSGTNQDSSFTIGYTPGSGEGFAPLSTATPEKYTIQVTYPNTNALGTATLTVN